MLKEPSKIKTQKFEKQLHREYKCRRQIGEAMILVCVNGKYRIREFWFRVKKKTKNRKITDAEKERELRLVGIYMEVGGLTALKFWDAVTENVFVNGEGREFALGPKNMVLSRVDMMGPHVEVEGRKKDYVA